MDPSKPMPLLEQSEKLKVQLTDEEKARLIRDGKAALGNNLQKFLQENKLTEQQFEGQILEMGRALKTASRELEMGLPNELINQSLLVDAGRKSGLAKVAFHRYIEFKHGPEFEQLASFADLSPNQLRDKLIEQFLADLMKEKINGTAEVRDSDILQLYKDNLDRFKNYIRFSQIVIAAPMQDLGAMESVRTQVMRQRPDLKGPALEEEIKNTEERQHQKALSVLAQIKNGANFADLCNTVTEDLPMRAAKQGGDMGYVSEDELKKNKLLAPVYQELQKLHPGEVCPEPVRTMFGWHIVKLTDRPRNGMVPFSAVKDDLKKAAVAQNSHLAVSTWIMEKRKTVPVTLGKEFEKALDEFEASKKK